MRDRKEWFLQLKPGRLIEQKKPDIRPTIPQALDSMSV